MNLNLIKSNTQTLISTFEIAKAFQKDHFRLYPIIDDILAFDEERQYHDDFHSVISRGNRNQRLRSFLITHKGFRLLCQNLKGLDLGLVFQIDEALQGGSTPPQININIENINLSF